MGVLSCLVFAHRPRYGRGKAKRTMNSPMRALALAVAAVTTTVTLAGPAAAAESAKPYGVDVSHYDQNYAWAQKKAQKKLSFGIAKATEGLSHNDDTFAANWARMRDAGLVRGAYHYGHPGNDPVAEADHFLGVVGKTGLQDGDLLALDLETTDGRSQHQVNAWAKKWLNRVQAKTGVKPVFYSSWYFAQQYGDGLGGYPLWVAHYGKKAGALKPPAPWKSWTIHQYSSTDHDNNVSSRTPAELRALGYHVRG